MRKMAPRRKSFGLEDSILKAVPTSGLSPAKYTGSKTSPTLRQTWSWAVTGEPAPTLSIWLYPRPATSFLTTTSRLLSPSLLTTLPHRSWHVTRELTLNAQSSKIGAMLWTTAIIKEPVIRPRGSASVMLATNSLIARRKLSIWRTKSGKKLKWPLEINRPHW